MVSRPSSKTKKSSIMRKFVVLLGLLWGIVSLHAQGDTTIYQVAEEPPRFPACEELDTTEAAKAQCAEEALLAFMYSNIQYPLEARQNGDQGTVVVSFVVEKDGSISNPEIVRDIGGGCGLETIRVVNLMNDAMQQAGVGWKPGRVDGRPVRARVSLPIRFRLKEAPPYTMVEEDTVYTRFDEPLQYEGGTEALFAKLNEKLDYPDEGNDSCRVGVVDISLLVKPDGNVKILDVTDYNNLGFDFWYEASESATSTMGGWIPAVYKGRKVPAAYELSLNFTPTADHCKRVVENYDRASALADEGMQLFNNEQQEAGVAKLTEAIELFPDDANFLYLRGQAYLAMDRFDEACADLTKARDISLENWYDELLPVICRGQ